MRQFLGLTLMSMVLTYVVIRDRIAEASGKLMNDALEDQRNKKLAQRRSSYR